MGRRKKWFTREEARKKWGITPDGPPEKKWFSEEEVRGMPEVTGEEAPASEETEPNEPASPEPELSPASTSSAEESAPEPNLGDAGLTLDPVPATASEPAPVSMVVPGTGPRPRRKKEKAPAPVVAPVALADQPIPAMTLVLSQAIQTLGLGLAASVDECWKFTEDEAKLIARPIARMMPTTDDPKTELAIALAAVVAPKLIVTFQHRRQRMIDARRGFHLAAVPERAEVPPSPSVAPAPPPPRERVTAVEPNGDLSPPWPGLS